MTNWKPIDDDTPRDGTPILAYGEKSNEWAVIVWEPVHQSWACVWDNWPLEAFAAKWWRDLPKPPESNQ